jgi:hypothetical protein
MHTQSQLCYLITFISRYSIISLIWVLKLEGVSYGALKFEGGTEVVLGGTEVRGSVLRGAEVRGGH